MRPSLCRTIKSAIAGRYNAGWIVLLCAVFFFFLLFSVCFIYLFNFFEITFNDIYSCLHSTPFLPHSEGLRIANFNPATIKAHPLVVDYYDKQFASKSSEKTRNNSTNQNHSGMFDVLFKPWLLFVRCILAFFIISFMFSLY
jgi:hypothetical protein